MLGQRVGFVNQLLIKKRYVAAHSQRAESKD